MIDSWRLSRVKLHVLSTISFVLIIFVIFFTYNFFSIFSLQVPSGSNINSNVVTPVLHPLKIQRSLESKLTQEPTDLVQGGVTLEEDEKEEEDCDDYLNLVPDPNLSIQERIEWFKERLSQFQILKSTRLATRFDARVRKFIKNQCKIVFFYTWISPVGKFRNREFSAMESIFKSNPDGCLIILSRNMDSIRGRKIMKPLLDQGFKILTVTPDLSYLFRNTPGEAWLNSIKRGEKDPGKIPLAQNLSNLIRLAVLYNYGGVYLDTDFIVLKDFSGLKNSIGAQGVDINGNWRILNNAVLVFDQKHPLLYKFMEEFSSSYDGNKWGHNGPYLVSRVIQRTVSGPAFNYTVLSPTAFYPVDWVKIGGFFTRPNGTRHSRWVEAKLVQLRADSYGVHLWNRETRRLRIEEGSIMGRLISDHCVICRNLYSS